MEVLSICRNAGPRNVRVFGSCARGEDNLESDIELLITPPEGLSLFDLSAVTRDLADLLGFRVDLRSDVGPGSSIGRILAEAVLL
ncbi:nucleotidyltransferase [Arthrobacter sp. AQ5-06]|nr:nucleotidyltransferase [Arthrobacter sp. AQ5-06]